MYSYSDFERLFVRYKAEAVPAGISIQNFCNQHNVPYNLFEKWYRDTRHKLVPVQVLDVPQETSPGEELERTPPGVSPPSSSGSLRILVDIRVSDGVHISQKNLSYDGLKELVKKLEVLC